MDEQDSIVHYLKRKRSDSSKGFYSFKRLSQYPPGPGEVAFPVSIVERQGKEGRQLHNHFLNSLLLLGRGSGCELYNLPIHPQVARLIWSDKNFVIFDRFERHIGNCSASELFALDASNKHVFHDNMKKIMKRLISLVGHLIEHKIPLSDHIPLSDVVFSAVDSFDPQLISFGHVNIQRKGKGQDKSDNLSYICLCHMVEDLMKKFNLDKNSASPFLSDFLNELSKKKNESFNLRDIRDVRFLQNHPALWKAGSSCMFVSLFKLHMVRFGGHKNFVLDRVMKTISTTMLHKSWTSITKVKDPSQLDVEIQNVITFYKSSGKACQDNALGLLTFERNLYCHYNEKNPGGWVNATELEAWLEKAFPSSILDLYKVSCSNNLGLGNEKFQFEEQPTLTFWSKKE